MVENFDELVNSAIAGINKLKGKRGILKKPVEERTLPEMLDVLDYVISSVSSITGVVRLEGQASREIYATLAGSQNAPFNVEHLQAAESFYSRMLNQGHFTVGSVISALKEHNVPEDFVREAATSAYLHEPLRQAILAGYGITPLVPPKRLPQKPI